MTLVRIPIDLTWSGASGSPGVNIWHARFDTGAIPTPADLQEVVDALQTFYATIDGLYPNTLTASFAGEAAGVGPDSGDTFTANPWSEPGDNANGYLSPATMMYVNWSTSTGGRRGRGRTFIGPLDAGVREANGTPTEEARGVLQGAVDALVSSSLSDNGWAVGVWSRTDAVLRDFTSGSVPNMFAVLRSRRD